MMTKALNSEKMNNRLNAIDQMMKKSKYSEEYDRAKKGVEQIQKDYNLPTYEEMRAKAAKPIPGSKSVLKGETKPVTVKPKATSLRTKDGKINTMHPAVNYAIESYSKKSGMSKKQVSDWVRKEGEPPNHDDWDQVIEEYNKKKKR